eukprot:14721-Heterococcus_DN1.PRE.2
MTPCVKAPPSFAHNGQQQQHRSLQLDASASIDAQDAASGEGGVVGQQEAHKLGNLLRLACPRDQLHRTSHAVKHFLWNARASNVGVDDAWRHSVHTGAVCCCLDGL